MTKIRKIVTHPKFREFLLNQPERVRKKIGKTVAALESQHLVPANHFKHIEGTKGLYEIRVQLGSDIWRIFCCFDRDQVVILLSGFQKKSRKIPRKEIETALRLMYQYFDSK